MRCCCRPPANRTRRWHPGLVQDPLFHVRRATAADAGMVAGLAAELAQSFPFSRAAFGQMYPAVLAATDACLLLATEGADGGMDLARPVGYLLGFQHPAFFANGPVAWVEEVLVRPEYRGRGAGRALMTAFEQHAVGQGCRLAALATRRAAAFYQALGYQESAVYFRKVLGDTSG
jgi:GNAT superfamily N-acetyltransferase